MEIREDSSNSTIPARSGYAGLRASAIRADVLTLTRKKKIATAHVTPRIRAIVHWRDLGICQYCLGNRIPGELIIEHVIPASNDGVAELHNLVLACQSCNGAKSDATWIPNNLIAITPLHISWRERVIEMATHNPTAITFDPATHLELQLAISERVRNAEEMWRTDRPTNGAERIASLDAFVQKLQTKRAESTHAPKSDLRAYSNGKSIVPTR